MCLESENKGLKNLKNKFVLGLIVAMLVLLFWGFLPIEKDTKITLVGGLPPHGEVWLTGIEINGAKSDLNDYTLTGKWKKIEGSIVYVPDTTADGNKLDLVFHNAEAVKLIFNKHPWSGGLGIQDGADFTRYDLYAQTGQEIYSVKNIQLSEWNEVDCIFSTILFLIIVCCLGMIREKYQIDFGKNWLYTALCVMVIAVALGAAEDVIYPILWILLIYILLQRRKKVNYLYFWICVLASYIYRIYYFYNPYLLSAKVVFTFLLCLYLLGNLGVGKGKKWSRYIAMVVAPILGVCIVERVSNIDISQLSIQMFILNVILMALYFSICVNLVRFKNLGWYFAYGSIFVISVINYYVIQFKKYAVSPADLLQFNTALNVAGDYQYYLSDAILYGAGLLILGIVLTKNYISEIDINRKSFLWSKVFGVASLLILMGWIHLVDFQMAYDISWNEWDTTKTYSKNGFMVSFITAAQRMKIDKPDGYSKGHAGEILDKYGAAGIESISVQKPVIIAIMNESFSDLSDLGDLGNTDNVMEYYNSLDCLEKGRTYVSVRGGGTCNSEFEFLTGNSLEFYNNIYPYTQFNFEDVPTVVSLLKEQGYRTIAMHPANPTNYGRESVYKEMGFDEFYSFDEYAQYEKIFLDRISDMDDYREIVKVISNTEEPVFIFNVTIQNHGDYDISTLNSKYELIEMDEKFTEYKDAQMYLTLMNESNKALKYLIEELEKMSRPVILCMFGDHQPGCLDPEFESQLIQIDDTQSELYNTEQKYGTPYLIWSNYQEQQEMNDNMACSPNYLASRLLQYAGAMESPYQKFLLDMQTYVPACNAFGYLGDDGNWHSYSEDTKYTEWFEKYRILQYYNMFDDNK